jgi:hypothetical protein
MLAERRGPGRALGVLMVTSDWPWPGTPRTTVFIRRQAEFVQVARFLQVGVCEGVSRE